MGLPRQLRKIYGHKMHPYPVWPKGGWPLGHSYRHEGRLLKPPYPYIDDQNRFVDVDGTIRDLLPEDG
jgi:hypothetical protein